jgi:hypothetical protein
MTSQSEMSVRIVYAIVDSLIFSAPAMTWCESACLAASAQGTTANGAQRVAVAAGFTMLAWPTKIVKAKVVILGLDKASQ